MRWKTKTSPIPSPTPIRGTGCKRKFRFSNAPTAKSRKCITYRWWSFRKHLVKTPDGFVITEFLTPVQHAGIYNSISCAAGFHIAEGRWLHDQNYLDDYIRFWLRATMANRSRISTNTAVGWRQRFMAALSRDRRQKFSDRFARTILSPTIGLGK